VRDPPPRSFRGTFPRIASHEHPAGRRRAVGFRPEHFLPPGVADRLGEHVSYQFHITHSEYLGAERILYGTMEGGPFQGRKVISRIPATHGASLAHGSTHAFAVANRDLKFFDPQTEKRTAPRRPPS